MVVIVTVVLVTALNMCLCLLIAVLLCRFWSCTSLLHYLTRIATIN